MEPGAAALAASTPLDDRQRQQLEAAHSAVARAGGPAMHRQADSRFHLTIAALSGSPRVIEAVTAVRSTLHEMLGSIRESQRRDDWTEEERARAEADLERIMSQVRRAAVDSE